MGLSRVCLWGGGLGAVLGDLGAVLAVSGLWGVVLGLLSGEIIGDQWRNRKGEIRRKERERAIIGS